MATTLLTIGPVHTLTQDAIYALPARACRMQLTGAATGLDIALDVAMTGPIQYADEDWETAGAYETGIPVQGGFVRATGGAANVVLAAV